MRAPYFPSLLLLPTYTACTRIDIQAFIPVLPLPTYEGGEGYSACTSIDIQAFIPVLPVPTYEGGGGL